jgi:hypothetical protein
MRRNPVREPMVVIGEPGDLIGDGARYAGSGHSGDTARLMARRAEPSDAEESERG